MNIKVTWFKPSGKYYSDGEELLKSTMFFEAVQEFREMVKSGKRPGLVDTLDNEFDAYVQFYTEFGPLEALFIVGRSF